MPIREQPRALCILITLLLAVALAIGGQRMPAVVPASAPAGEVSGARAMAVLQKLAAEPRPVGSAPHRQARELVVAELAAAGFAAEQKRAVLGIELCNLVVPIAGTAPTGTVLLLAHYDSVSRSPGAGDDGVGVVSWIEALRALGATGWRPRNDVLLLLTDGEERGLLGALAFARTDPRVAKVKTVVNLESIGNGGPAYLFELGPHNGARVRLFADTVARPAGSSFAEAVYHLLPNDTDLSIFLQRGTQGFNLALARGSCAYHAPHDTPEHIDPRSVQHMADCAAALARRLGDTDLGTLRGDDVTFFDCYGFGFVVTPRAFEPWFAALAIALSAGAVWRLRPGPRVVVVALLRHVVGVALLLALVVAAAWSLRWAAGQLLPRGPVAGNTTSAALLFASAVAFAVSCTLPRIDADRQQVPLRAAIAAVLWGLVGAVAAFWLPGTSYAFSWPAIAVSLQLLLPLRARDSFAATLVPFVVACVVGLPILHLLTQLMAPDPVVAVGIVVAAVASASRLLAVALVAVANVRAARRVLWGVAGAGLLGAAVVALGLGWRCGSLWP